MSGAPTRKPGAFVVDFSSVVALEEAIANLEKAWVAIPPSIRPKLSRFLLLSSDGQVVPYRRPDDPTQDGEGG